MKQKKLIFNFFVNRNWKKLTDSRKRAKILADNRKSHHPIETLMKCLFTWTERRSLRLFRKLSTRQNFHLKAQMFSFHSKFFVYRWLKRAPQKLSFCFKCPDTGQHTVRESLMEFCFCFILYTQQNIRMNNIPTHQQ